MQDRGTEYANSPFLEADPWRIIYPSDSKNKNCWESGQQGYSVQPRTANSSFSLIIKKKKRKKPLWSNLITNTSKDSRGSVYLWVIETKG